jgi:hypothetical protein
VQSGSKVDTRRGDSGVWRELIADVQLYSKTAG